MGEKVQGMGSINGRYKIDRGRLRILWKWRSQRTYMSTYGHELSVGDSGGGVVVVLGGGE